MLFCPHPPPITNGNGHGEYEQIPLLPPTQIEHESHDTRPIIKRQRKGTTPTLAAIIKLLHSQHYKGRQIGVILDVSESLVSKITTGKQWKDIESATEIPDNVQQIITALRY